MNICCDFLICLDACGANRWMKAMSPSSMTLPTMSTWDNVYQGQGHQGPPPQMPPTSQGRLKINGKFSTFCVLFYFFFFHFPVISKFDLSQVPFYKDFFSLVTDFFLVSFVTEFFNFVLNLYWSYDLAKIPCSLEGKKRKCTNI